MEGLLQMDFEQVIRHYTIGKPKRQKDESFIDYKYRQKLERLLIDYKLRHGNKKEEL